MNWNVTISKKTLYIFITVLLFLLWNIFFIYKSFYWKWNIQSDIETLYKRWSYESIINSMKHEELDQDWIYYLLLSYIKNNDFKSASDIFKETNIASKSANKIYKLLTFKKLEDREWLIEYGEILSSEDPQVRSVYLQMRAYAYYKLWKNSEAWILAEDSLFLDEFSWSSMVTLWLINVRKNKWTDALKNFERAKNLWFTPNDEFYYNLWLTEFYLKRHDTMLENFSQIDDNSQYAYDIALITWRYYLDNENYPEALKSFGACENIDSENWLHNFWLWRLYVKKWEWDKALNYQRKARDLNTWKTTNQQLLTDLIVSLSKTWNIDEMNIIEAIIQENLTWSLRNFELYILALQKAWLYEKAISIWNKAVTDLNDEKASDTISNLNIKSVIYKLLEEKWWEQEQEWLDKLINFQGNIKHRYLYIALWDYWSWDIESWLRALQEVEPSVSEDDLKTIQILNLIYSWDAKDALKKLTEYTIDPEFDIDYQRLKRKTLSLLQNWANDYKDEVTEQLKLLDQLENNDKSLNKSFERRFNKWLRYMREFYL